MKPALQRRCGRDNGFTLLELIVVMAILAMAAVIAFPSATSSRRGLTADAAALNFASALRIARAEAIRSNREQMLVLNVARRSYSAAGLRVARAIPTDVAVSYEIPPAEQSTDATAAVRFRPDGSSSGGTFRFAAHRKSASVAVDWLTGTARVALGAKTP
jgi:general secretion pathway protein H